MVGVLTYNIHSGVGTNGAYDLERVAGVIRRSKAEIACLQEAIGCGIVVRHGETGGLAAWPDCFGSFCFKA